MLKLISVTRVLSPFNDFSQVPPDRLEFAKQRGTDVHAACSAYARNLPVFASNGSAPYFESFRNWFDKYVKRALFVEAEFSDPSVYGIIGHVDLVAELTDGRVVVVDYKTPVAESKSWALQISAYCHLVNPIVGKCDGMALQLSPQGNMARAIHYKYQASDFAVFLSALTVWRHIHG
jgi:hypothetical protein